MRYHPLKIISLLFLFSCTGRNPERQKDISGNKEDANAKAKTEAAVLDSSYQDVHTAGKMKKVHTNATSDTMWFPFSDSSYQLCVHIFNTDASSEEEINSVITYNHIEGGKTKQIFQDSFYCMDNGYLLREDLNNDHVDDVLILCYSGARANPSYHLFLTDTIRHKLTFVKGFEELSNPSLDPVYNIIVSLAQSGSDCYSFYQINSKKKLIRLGHDYEERDHDSTQYEQAVRGIIMDRQKRQALNALK